MPNVPPAPVGRAQSQCSFCVMIENFVADLRVESHPFARAHLPKPLLIEVIGETPKAKY